jgi:hypothetical protein
MTSIEKKDYSTTNETTHIIGPVSMTQHYSVDFNMYIYIFGDEHDKYKELCGTKSNEKAIRIDDLVINILDDNENINNKINEIEDNNDDDNNSQVNSHKIIDVFLEAPLHFTLYLLILYI